MNTTFFKNEFIDIYKKYNMMQEANPMNHNALHAKVKEDLENVSVDQKPRSTQILKEIELEVE